MLLRNIKIRQDLSFFLFGPRQCGKTTLIQSLLPPLHWTVDLLKTDEFLKYNQDPSQFRKDAEFQIKQNQTKVIFVDEIQKIPLLLDEIQHLMQQHSECRFILTGSSSRKLKRSGANLLAGRAVQYFLFPFIYGEVKQQFVLNSTLQFGLLPALVDKDNETKKLILNTYAQTYLREEIQQEGLVRNLGGFSRFLNVAASQFTELTKYTAIGSECQVKANTVKGYYDILEDTLIGFRLYGWERSVRKQLSSYPKFYLFDNGVTNSLNRLLGDELSPVVVGKLFEQWLINEVRARLSYAHSNHSIFYWRTNNDMEVDLIIAAGKEPIAAIKFKCVSSVQKTHLRGLKSFSGDYPHCRRYLVSLVSSPYEQDGIFILPWQNFLEKELSELL